MPDRRVLACGCEVERERGGAFLIAWCDEHVSLVSAPREAQERFARAAMGEDVERVSHPRERFEYSGARLR